MLAARFWLPQDISSHGSSIDQLIGIVHYFMLVLFVGWGIFFIYCLVKFRARSGHAAGYDPIKAKPSKYAEIIVVVIEAVLLVGISIPVWASYRAEPPKDPEHPPMQVRVVAQQFAWNIHYPGPDGKFGKTKAKLVDETMNPIGLDESDPAAGDDVVMINNFYVPKDRDVIVRLSSKDVIHAFAVPMLRVKQDAIPGMEVPVWFKATKTNDEVREKLIRTITLPTDPEAIKAFGNEYKSMIFMADFGGSQGSPIAHKGGWINGDVIAELVSGGVTEITMAPKDPVNIQCAQLCGLGHYRMMGQMQILEPAAFDEWYASQGAEDEFLDEGEEEEFDN